jgi:hypothetical protein
MSDQLLRDIETIRTELRATDEPASEYELRGNFLSRKLEDGIDLSKNISPDINRDADEYHETFNRLKERVTEIEQEFITYPEHECMTAVGGMINGEIARMRDLQLEATQAQLPKINNRLQAALDVAQSLLPNLRELNPEMTLTRSGRFNIPEHEKPIAVEEVRYADRVPDATPGFHNIQTNLRQAHAYMQLVQMIDNTLEPRRRIDPLPKIDGLNYKDPNYDIDEQGDLLKHHALLEGYIQLETEMQQRLQKGSKGETEEQNNQRIAKIQDELFKMRNRLEGRTQDLLDNPEAIPQVVDRAESRRLELRGQLERVVIGNTQRTRIYRQEVLILDDRLRDLGVNQATRNNIMNKALKWKGDEDDTERRLYWPLFREEIERTGCTAKDIVEQSKMTPIDRFNKLLDDTKATKHTASELLEDGTSLPHLEFDDLDPSRHRNPIDLERTKYISLLMKSGKYNGKITAEEFSNPGEYPLGLLQEMLMIAGYTREGEQPPRRRPIGGPFKFIAPKEPEEDVTPEQQRFRTEIKRRMDQRETERSTGLKRREELSPLRTIFEDGQLPTIGDMLQIYQELLDTAHAVYTNGREAEKVAKELKTMECRILNYRVNDNFIERFRARRGAQGLGPEEEAQLRRLHVTPEDLQNMRRLTC